MNKPTEKQYLDAIKLVPYDSESVKMLEQLVKDHFKMIDHMKKTSLWSVFEYEELLEKRMVEPMEMVVYDNTRMKSEINALRKQLGKCDKYKELREMSFYIGESGSSGRKFDTFSDFLSAVNDLAHTYYENGEDCFEIEIVNG